LEYLNDMGDNDEDERPEKKKKYGIDFVSLESSIA
jgi:hypothetical protein